MIITYFKTLKKYRYMLSLFIKRDIEKKYKGAYLGIVWSLLNPLLTMIVLSIIFSTLFKRDIENFPLYMISGKIIFDFFSGTTNQSLKSLVNSANLLQKVNFPKYMMVLSTVSSGFVFFLISFIDLFLIVILTKASITWTFLLLPIYLCIFYVFVLGCSLFLSIANAIFRDIQHLYSVFVLLLYYFSAIFYPKDIVPQQFQFFYKLNPVYQFVEGFRDVIYYNQLPSMENFLMCIFYSIISISFGVLVFIKCKDKVIVKL